MDTGCSFPLLLDTWAAKQLHLSLTGQPARITNANKAAQVAKITSVEIAGKSLDTNQESFVPILLSDAIIADLGVSKDFPAPSPIAGFIGVSLFGDRTVQFDFAKQTLTLLLPTEQGFRAAGATTLPLKIVDKLYAVTAKSSSGSSVDLRVDTGSRWVVMHDSVARQFQLTPTPLVLIGIMGIAGIQTCPMVLIHSLPVGDLSEADLPTIINDGNLNLLGMNFLSRFRMTMDLKHKEMTLEQSADYAQKARMPGSPNVLAIKQHGDLVVYDVLPDSAAAQAGVHVGDTIVQVDGQDLSALSSESANNVLDGYAGTKAEIVVKGAGRQPIHYTRQSIFAMPSGRGVGVGIGITVTEKGAMIIEEVEARSPAQEAGLKAGDEIIEINGLPVRTTPFDHLATEMKKPEGAEIRLRVLHKGEDKPQEYKLVMRKLL